MVKAVWLALISGGLALLLAGAAERPQTPAKSDQAESATKMVRLHRERLNGGPQTIYAHSHVVRTSAVFYCKYETEVYITRDTPGGARFAVQKIRMHTKIGSDRLEKECDNSDTCQRTEQGVSGTPCGKVCVYATIDDPAYGQFNNKEQCEG